MNNLLNSKNKTFNKLLLVFGIGCCTVLLMMSCKKKVVDPPKRIRFDVAAIIDASVTKSDSKAKANLTAEYLSSTKQFTYNLTYNGIEITQVDLHYGPMESLGAGVAILSKKGPKYISPLKGTIKLDLAAEDALFKDNLYINISSAKFPDGEIRGQLLIRDKK